MDTFQRQWLGFVGIVLGLLALFVALDGPAVAAGLITSKQIKNGTIQTKDISKPARTALKGQQGPTGPQGEIGLAGPQGEPGPDGSIVGAPAGGDLTGSYPDPQLGPDTVGTPELATVPSVGLRGSLTQVPSSTIVHLTWPPTPEWETVPSMYNGAQSTRLVAPVDGVYYVHASIGFSPNTTGWRSVSIVVNGDSGNWACFDRDQATTAQTWVAVGCMIDLYAGHYVTVVATQDSGVALSTMGSSETASLTWVGNLS